MEKQWFVAAKRADFEGLAEKFHIDPVIARIIRNRDIVTDEEIDEFLNGTMKDIPDPYLLPDMEQAVEGLRRYGGGKIRIIGDYDIDGVCASYILYRGLTSLGLRADTAIPCRMTDGYGLNDRLVEEAHRDGVDLIITCDNGIAAAPQAQLAASYGMKMIITDHHEVPYEEKEDHSREYLLPEALAVVDPKRADNRYPFPGICGAAVAFQLIRAMYPQGMPDGLFRELTEFAAFATVGDVMELKKENRILVREGLKLMRRSENAGLRALIAVNGLEGKELTPYHVGFVLGPCLNATGRLDKAERALSLFTCGGYREALMIAQELKGLNDSRKDLTRKGVEQALEQAEQMNRKGDPVFVLYLKDCHESLAGIIAGRIRERYHHPVFVLTDAEDGVKGSGRSIEAYSMYEEMTACRELFTRFGGHRMAAGLSLPRENVEEFRRRINRNAALSEGDFVEKIHIDVPMPLSYVTLGLIEQLSVLAPFGNGNPRPVFAQRGLLFFSARLIGKNDRVMRFGVMDAQGRRYSMTMFGEHGPFDDDIREAFGEDALAALYDAKGSVRLSVVYYPEINEFGGRREIQYVIQDYKK